jgi:hypothetical protein
VTEDEGELVGEEDVEADVLASGDVLGDVLGSGVPEGVVPVDEEALGRSPDTSVPASPSERSRTCTELVLVW